MIDILLIFLVSSAFTFYMYRHYNIPSGRSRMNWIESVAKGNYVNPYNTRVLYSLACYHLCRLSGISVGLMWLILNFIISVLLFTGMYLATSLIGMLILAFICMVTCDGFRLDDEIVTATLFVWILLSHGWVAIILLILLAFTRLDQFLFAVPVAYLLHNISIPYWLIPFGVGYWQLMKKRYKTPHIHSWLKPLINNTNKGNILALILPMWIALVLPFIIWVIVYWGSVQDKMAILCLIPYTLTFFVLGNMWELGKYLPFWILILMSLTV